MNCKKLLAAFAGLGMIAVAPFAQANIQEAIKYVESKGYHAISELELDHGVFYEFTALDSNNQQVEVVYNIKTKSLVANEIASEKMMPMSEVLAKLKEKSFHDIYEIDLDKDPKLGLYYEVEALDKDNKKVEVHVLAETGEIIEVL